MRLIAPLLFCIIGAAAGALLSGLFGRRGTGARVGAIAGLLGGFAGLFLRDLLDVELGGALTGAMVAVASGALLAALAVNVVALLGGKRPRD